MNKFQIQAAVKIKRHLPTFSRIATRFKEKMENKSEDKTPVENRDEKRREMIEAKMRIHEIEKQTFTIWNVAISISTGALFSEFMLGTVGAFLIPLQIDKFMRDVGDLGGLVLLAPPLLPIVFSIGIETFNYVRVFCLDCKIAKLDEE